MIRVEYYKRSLMANKDLNVHDVIIRDFDDLEKSNGLIRWIEQQKDRSEGAFNYNAKVWFYESGRPPKLLNVLCASGWTITGDSWRS